MYGYYAQGVDVNTATLADGWQDRLVRFSPAAANGATGLCLERHDLAISKLVAGRPKAFEFVTALLDAGLVDVGEMRTRADLLPVVPMRIRCVREWVDAHVVSRTSP